MDEETDEQEKRELTQDPEHLVEDEEQDDGTEQAREEGGLRKAPEDKAEDTEDKHHPS
jgi:hypothetical protein